MPAAPQRVVSGIDLVEIVRFRRLLGADPAHAVPWLFTDAERAYALSFHDPVPRLAARFAAKEAVLKVIGDVSPFSFDWQTIEISGGQGGGRPMVSLTGEAADAAGLANLGQIEVSITHSRHFAAAIAIATVMQ